MGTGRAPDRVDEGWGQVDPLSLVALISDFLTQEDGLCYHFLYVATFHPVPNILVPKHTTPV